MVLCRGAVVAVIVWQLNLQLPVQSVPITTKVVSSNPGHASWRGVLDTKLCDKICQLIAADGWFSLGTLVSSINKTGHHDIAEILFKVDFVSYGLYFMVKIVYFF